MPNTKHGSTSRSAFAHDPGAGKMAARDATNTTVRERAINLLDRFEVPQTDDNINVVTHILMHEAVLVREELRNAR